MRLSSSLIVLLCLCIASADVYMQHPRGSNNRLNEQSAERNNGNRLFDSQNNNRGGYNVGDKANKAFDQNNPYSNPATTFTYTTPPTGGYTPTQYQFLYFEQSVLRIEWTNQHGCGGNEKSDPQKDNCDITLQYTCDADYDTATSFDAKKKAGKLEELKVFIKDGGNTNTPDEPNSYNEIATTTASNDNQQRGRHESEAWYYMCKRRERNFGLFHADQNLKGSSAKYTRQNPNGNRRGLECPEERDYYPYWKPTPWVDIAILTDHTERCPWYLGASHNNNSVCACDGILDTATENDLIPLTQAACENKTGATWVCYDKGLPAPFCGSAPWTRVNHLGNGRDGQMVHYDWTLPSYQSLIDYGVKPRATGFIPCVLRLRYNISTDDYNAYDIDARFDSDERNGIESPIEQNPTIDIGSFDLVGLRLAINTNQFGRTFQDRSHLFYIAQRTDPALDNQAIWNLNVRGKRGNIVQTYPSNEYDFVPNELTVQPGTFLHLQWTGSNTHNNGNPAGDGQAGDAGEGTGGTDRHNFVALGSADENYPLPQDKFAGAANNIWTHLDVFTYDYTSIPTNDAIILAATSGQYRSVADISSVTTDMDPLLNDAPASLVGGLLLKVKASGSGKTLHYTCTRNNNFSNRSQKGWLKIA